MSIFKIKNFSLKDKIACYTYNNIQNYIFGFLVLGSIATSISYRTSVFNVTLLLACFVFYLIPNKSFDFKNSSKVIKYWVYVIFAYSFIWLLSIYNTDGSSSSDYEKPIKMLAIALIAIQLYKINISYRFVMYGMVGCIFMVFVYTLSHNYARLELEMNAGTAAYQLSIPVLLCLSFLFFKKDIKFSEKFLLALASLIGFFVLSETQTRGAVVVIFVYFLIVFVIKLYQINRNKRIYFSVAAIFIACLTSYSISSIPVVDHRIKATIKDIKLIQSGNLQGSIGRRIALYHVSLEAIKNPTLLGGGENSLKNLKRYIASMDNGDSYKFLEANLHFHNEYLDHFTKRGIIGLITFIFLLLLPIIYADKSNRPFLLAVIIPLAIGGMIETPFNNSNFEKNFPLYVTFILVMKDTTLSHRLFDRSIKG